MFPKSFQVAVNTEVTQSHAKSWQRNLADRLAQNLYPLSLYGAQTVYTTHARVQFCGQNAGVVRIAWHFDIRAAM